MAKLISQVFNVAVQVLSHNYAPINVKPPPGEAGQGLGISLNILAPGGGICSANESQGWGHLTESLLLLSNLAVFPLIIVGNFYNI